MYDHAGRGRFERIREVVQDSEKARLLTGLFL